MCYIFLEFGGTIGSWASVYGRGSETQVVQVKCWKCGNFRHKRQECRAAQCYECKGFRHRKFECPKRRERGSIATTTTPATTPKGSQFGSDFHGQPERGRGMGTSFATAPP